MDVVAESPGNVDSSGINNFAKLRAAVPDLAIAGGREFALGEIDRRLTAKPETVGTFWREVSGSAAAHHPDITALYCFLESEAGRYALVEFIAGETLEDLVKRSDPESCERGIPLFCRMLDAVEGLSAKEQGALQLENRSSGLELSDFGVLRVRGQVRSKLYGTVMIRPDGFWAEQILGDSDSERPHGDPLLMAACQKLTGQAPPGSAPSIQLDDCVICSLIRPPAPAMPRMAPPAVPVPSAPAARPLPAKQASLASRLGRRVVPYLIALGTALLVLIAFFGVGGYFARRAAVPTADIPLVPPSTIAGALPEDLTEEPAVQPPPAAKGKVTPPAATIAPKPTPAPKQAKGARASEPVYSPAAKPAATNSSPQSSVQLARGTRPIRQTRLDYPAEAKRDRVSGLVELRLTIGEDGTVQSAKLLSGHPLLVAGLTEAISKWVYQPIRVDGKPMPMTTDVAIQFQLDK
ncbi:MAG: TonB family protein [Bryobacteraceae bacterium]